MLDNNTLDANKTISVCNIWNHLILCKQMSPDSCKKLLPTDYSFANYIYSIYM